MTTSRLKEIYSDCDREAAHAYVLGDPATELKWLQARKTIGQILREKDPAAWKKAFDARSRQPERISVPA